MNGITFGGYHSYRDFSLILAQKTIGTPSPKTEVIDIPGGDGVLDFTEFFGEVKYNNRQLSFDFSTLVRQEQFMDLFSTVQNALHGQKMKIVLDDDPECYYIGRITVNEWKADRNIGKLTIDCDCEPFKYTPVSQAVHLCGKNLLNLDAGILTDEGVWVKTETGYTFTRKTGTGGTFVYWEIPVAKGRQYIFSADYTLTTRLLYVYKDKLYGELVAKVNAGQPAIFTAEESGIYVFGAYATSAATEAVFTNFMIQEGNEVGTYEAYDATDKELAVTFSNSGKKTAVPKAFTTGTVTAETDATFSTLTEGEYTMTEFPFKPGETTLTFNGNGITVVEWIERGL